MGLEDLVALGHQDGLHQPGDVDLVVADEDAGFFVQGFIIQQKAGVLPYSGG